MRTAKLVNITPYKADSFYGTRISGTDLLLAPPPHCQQLRLNLRNLLMYRSQPRALDDSTSFGRSPPRMNTGSCVSSGARRDKHKSTTVHANARAAVRLAPRLTSPRALSAPSHNVLGLPLPQPAHMQPIPHKARSNWPIHSTCPYAMKQRHATTRTRALAPQKVGTHSSKQHIHSIRASNLPIMYNSVHPAQDGHTKVPLPGCYMPQR